nr:nuclear receptor-binding protein homolog isoform X2 [Onthophagus taurus]
MSGNQINEEPHKSPRESGEDSEDESEILEESPCGRWLKRREEVEQRDVPGIDWAYLAMDTEEGVEVVWNEVQFSERKNFKAQEEHIRQVFENLTQLEHPNIVKFHRYWTDTHNDKPRVIFITEYMSSGSLKQFLKRTKRNVKRLPLQAWKRWCTQILSALSYLHSCSTPITHGNLTCDTIFIQHNGLVKIGSVAPEQIHHHVKTYQDSIKNMHFVAPEFAQGVKSNPAMDIYAFGMCALEMAALEIQGNGDSGNVVTDENVEKTIESLEDNQQKDFIKLCLNKDPYFRPTAPQLLFHPLLFEVHSLKLLAAHCLVNKSAANITETITDELMQRVYRPEVVIAEVRYGDRIGKQTKLSDVHSAEKLEKFIEDVKNGIYPLTAFGIKQPPSRSRAMTPESTESEKSVTPEPTDVETRKIVSIVCEIKDETPEIVVVLQLQIVLRMDDKMNRQLTTIITHQDIPQTLAQDLVHYGFINEHDQARVASEIEEAIHHRNSGHSSPSHAFPQIPMPINPPCQLSTNPPPLSVVSAATTQVPMHSTS